MARPEDEFERETSSVLPIDPDLLTVETTEERHDPNRHRKAQRTILIVIGCAGVVGALSRYAMSRLITVPSGHFPWSTFWINVTGSLVIGFVLVMLIERFPRARVARPLVATGFLGAYTTFSTYMVDSDLLFKAHKIATGIIYAFGSLGAGVTATAAGILFARFIIRLDHGLNEQLS